MCYLHIPPTIYASSQQNFPEQAHWIIENTNIDSNQCFRRTIAFVNALVSIIKLLVKVIAYPLSGRSTQHNFCCLLGIFIAIDTISRLRFLSELVDGGHTVVKFHSIRSVFKHVCPRVSPANSACEASWSRVDFSSKPGYLVVKAKTSPSLVVLSTLYCENSTLFLGWSFYTVLWKPVHLTDHERLTYQFRW